MLKALHQNVSKQPNLWPSTSAFKTWVKIYRGLATVIRMEVDSKASVKQLYDTGQASTVTFKKLLCNCIYNKPNLSVYWRFGFVWFVAIYPQEIPKEK